MDKEEEKRQKKTGMHELRRRHGFVCFARTFEKSGEHSRWLCFVLRWEDAAGERLTFILFLVLPVLPLSPRGMNLLNSDRETCSHRERRERRQ